MRQVMPVEADIQKAEFRMLALGALFAAMILAGAARACDDPLNCPSKMKMVDGSGLKVTGGEIKTWAKLNPAKQVREVGVTIPFALIENPPAPDAMDMAMPGMGGKGDIGEMAGMPPMPPHKVIARIPFPKEVRKTAWFDHFEMDWNPEGHEPKVFGVPHFDFHFYAIPKEKVDAINSFDPNPPASKFMPEGYIYPGKDTYIPKMGVHAVKPSVLEPPFTAVMIAGFDKGRMHFVEPMITQEFLKRKQPFTLELPRPKELGRKALYPTKFAAEYDEAENAYRFVFSAFEPMT